MSIIWFLIPSSPFFWSCFYFLIALLGIILVWVHFHLFYFLFVSEGPFDGGYVSNDLGEDIFVDSNDKGQTGSYFGLGGIWRAAV
jgi:hypothetical protein